MPALSSLHSSFHHPSAERSSLNSSSCCTSSVDAFAVVPSIEYLPSGLISSHSPSHDRYGNSGAGNVTASNISSRRLALVGRSRWVTSCAPDFVEIGVRWYGSAHLSFSSAQVMRSLSYDSILSVRHLSGFCNASFFHGAFIARKVSRKVSLGTQGLSSGFEHRHRSTVTKDDDGRSAMCIPDDILLAGSCGESNSGNDAKVSHFKGLSPYVQDICGEGAVELKAETPNGLNIDTTSEAGVLIDQSLVGRPRGQPERRRKVAGVQDLLTVPGIGPRNMEKLVAKGIAKLDELKQLYREKFRTDGTEKMVEFLRSSVGILHKHHAASITAFIKDTVEEEASADGNSTDKGVRSKKRLTFCVEGNISVGKTTFLQKIANETLELRDLVEIVPEPIAKWQDVGPDHFNILDAFYAEPQRYAYTFQNYVFVTRLMQERESAKGERPLRLMERSVFSDRMVFVRAVHEAKWMNEMEISIYDSWFDPVVSVLPGLVPDAFIYLRASPDTCHRRLQMRKRPEEQTVTLDYLRGLHEKHEQWLFPAEHDSKSVLSISQWPTAMKEPISSRIKDRVFYLQGEHVHSSIQKVPALVLDCEASIDFSRDVEAKAEYARQVAEFFEYVQDLKDGQLERNQAASQLLLPRAGGLVGPDGALLRTSSQLDGVDLRRHISTCCA